MGGKDKAISLVRKILAKAQNNNNEHEVEVALLKAQEVLVKNGLDFSDVEGFEVPPKKEVVDADITDTETTLWWVWELGNTIGNNFRCDCIKRNRKRKSHLRFIGLKEDVAIAKELFIFARESLEYFSTCYIVNLCDEINLTPIDERPLDKRKNFTIRDFTNDKNDYIKGFLKGLDSKFKEQVEKNNWGLILVKDNMITEYIKENLKLRSATIPSANKGSGNATHYNAGFNDGYSLQYRNDLLTN